MLMNGIRRFKTRRHDLISIMHLLPSREVHSPEVWRFSQPHGQWNSNQMGQGEAGLMYEGMSNEIWVTLHQTHLLLLLPIPSQCESYSCCTAWIVHGHWPLLMLKEHSFKDILETAKNSTLKYQMVSKNDMRTMLRCVWTYRCMGPSKLLTVSSRHLQIINNMTYKQSKVDPCLYFAWIGGEMVVFVAWANDI